MNLKTMKASATKASAMKAKTMNNSGISLSLIAVSGIILLLFIAWGIVLPENFTEVTSGASGYIVANFRWYYIFIFSVFLYFCVGIAISPWGKIRIGIARISRGRTIREFIVGVLLVPTLLSLVWLAVMGGTALNIELLAGGEGGILSATKEASERAMFATFAAMDIGVALEFILSLIGLTLVVIFFITSCDSGTLVLSMITSKGNLEPPKGLRLFWGVIIGGVALALLLSGGLGALQTAAIVSALPFSVVMILMLVSLFRALAAESSASSAKSLK